MLRQPIQPHKYRLNLKILLQLRGVYIENIGVSLMGGLKYREVLKYRESYTQRMAFYD